MSYAKYMVEYLSKQFCPLQLHNGNVIEPTYFIPLCLVKILMLKSKKNGRKTNVNVCICYVEKNKDGPNEKNRKKWTNMN